MATYEKCEQIQTEMETNKEFLDLVELGEYQEDLLKEDSNHPFKLSAETFGVRNQSRKLGNSKTYTQKYDRDISKQNDIRQNKESKSFLTAAKKKNAF